MPSAPSPVTRSAPSATRDGAAAGPAAVLGAFRGAGGLQQGAQVAGHVGGAQVGGGEHELAWIGHAGEHGERIVAAAVAGLDVGVEAVADGQALPLGHGVAAA